MEFESRDHLTEHSLVLPQLRPKHPEIVEADITQLDSTIQQFNPNMARSHSSRETENTPPHLNNIECAPILHAVEQRHEPKKPLLVCVDIALFNAVSNDIGEKVTALLDSSSSQSYITNELAEKLQLQPSSHQKIDMYTFASDTPVSLSATSHTIGIRCIDNSEASLDVQAIPILTKELKHVFVNESELDHTISISGSIPRILFGMDYFWNLVFNDQFRIHNMSNGSSQFCVIYKRLGKIITIHFATTKQTKQSLTILPPHPIQKTAMNSKNS
ncbi:unnamed protein product [Nippostrongylus brasiliensis]|uniref:DUF1758 domain-containing protein n=1 Tax=Nippostrongylus brasiliensis TaxID=27835 RepID=A0A0N4XXW9_NIPBR|nr:unnamed protein product [Nippostrongylus brasiliensis]